MRHNFISNIQLFAGYGSAPVTTFGGMVMMTGNSPLAQ